MLLLLLLPKKGGYVFKSLCLSVCLSVCLLDYSKSYEPYERIMMKFFEWWGVAHVPSD